MFSMTLSEIIFLLQLIQYIKVGFGLSHPKCEKICQCIQTAWVEIYNDILLETEKKKLPPRVKLKRFLSS